jgi:curli biogenesis system outer membrane secretion channel CsgG
MQVEFPPALRYNPPMISLRVRWVYLVAALLLTCGGCITLPERSKPDDGTLKPVVAVMDFENRSGFKGNWRLGSGMAELLTTELLETDRFILLERKHLDDVVSELLRQGRDLFREEGQVPKGRLRNAQYLIRGTVTDFTVTGDASGWFGSSKGGGNSHFSRSRVALNLRVSDIETGEIIASVITSDSAASFHFGGGVNYKSIAFGGGAFFRTPLGKATRSAIRRAIKEIEEEIPRSRWMPRVAEVGPDDVVINGGLNVNLEPGLVFLCRGAGRIITDPTTGDAIETVPGPITGRIEIREVLQRSAHAIVLEGEPHRGNFLEPAQ